MNINLLKTIYVYMVGGKTVFTSSVLHVSIVSVLLKLLHILKGKIAAFLVYYLFLALFTHE